MEHVLFFFQNQTECYWMLFDQQLSGTIGFYCVDRWKRKAAENPLSSNNIADIY